MKALNFLLHGTFLLTCFSLLSNAGKMDTVRGSLMSDPR